MTISVLTPLQLIAGASLLQNQGLVVSPGLGTAISAYSSTPLMTAFFDALALDGSLATLAANTVPAFSNSLPAAYSALGTQMTTVINTQASYDAGSGDISKFVQAVNVALGYSQTTNQFINSAVNSQTYLGNTFSTTNDMITGDITKVNLATPAFGTDLANLGDLINLNNLAELGSPLALVQQIIATVGNIPVLSVSFLLAGVPDEIVLNLTNPTVSVTDSIQKLMYQAMTTITGTDLTQILKILKVKTVNIETLADLLNPVKLFPNSYLSLTVNTPNGIRAIYLNDSGAVNTTLKTVLPAYVVSRIDRLEVITPPDWALANQSLGTALSQVTGISNTPLPVFSATVKNLQTTRNLPLITGLTSAVPPAVANYYTSTLAVGGGSNGDVRAVDVIGLAAGWVATDAFAQTVAIFATMNLTYLTLIYQTMVNALDGTYGDTQAGPLIIPSGLPCAGTYLGTEIPPVPPAVDPTYNPTAIELAMTCLTGSALAEIAALQSTYPTQATELNTLWNSMATQVDQEDSLQTLINLDYADLQANSRTSIYSFIFDLPQYGLQTEVGGMAWFLENMADLTTQGGQAIIGCLREGQNQTALSASGIYTNSRIPSEPIPPPPTAPLLPADYTEAEAENLIVK